MGTENKPSISEIATSSNVKRKSSPPTMTYKDRIRSIILASEMKSLPLQDIYDQMAAAYPGQCSAENHLKWKNSIRHNLSLHKTLFMRTITGDRSEWCVILDYDKKNPTNKQSMILSRKDATFDRRQEEARPKARGRKRDEVEIKILVPPDIYRKHLSKERRLFLVPAKSVERLEQYYEKVRGKPLVHLSYEKLCPVPAVRPRQPETVLPTQFSKHVPRSTQQTQFKASPDDSTSDIYADLPDLISLSESQLYDDLPDLIEIEK